MTQPVSSGARWPQADASCSDPSRDANETLTCEEPPAPLCEAHRVQLMASSPSGPPHADVPAGLAFCRNADTVIEGFLCNERTVVSDACRKPTNDFDAFICDEPKMKNLQWVIVRETWAIVKSLAMSFRGKT